MAAGQKPVTLAHFVSPLWLWFTVFIGVNILLASVTGFCPAAILFRKLGVRAGCAFQLARGLPGVAA